MSIGHLFALFPVCTDIVLPTALDRSLILASLAIHNYQKFGESWLDIAQGNMRRQVEAGIRGWVLLHIDLKLVNER